MEKICPNCGEKNKEDERFCTYCGFRFKKQERIPKKKDDHHRRTRFGHEMKHGYGDDQYEQ